MEEANANSRSHVFAKDEDIKLCEAEIVHNASAPVLVEAALQREDGSYLTDTGALSVRSGAKTVVSDTPADLDKLAVELNPAVKFWDPLNLAEAEFWEESNEATIVSTSTARRPLPRTVRARQTYRRLSVGDDSPLIASCRAARYFQHRASSATRRSSTGASR